MRAKRVARLELFCRYWNGQGCSKCVADQASVSLDRLKFLGNFRVLRAQANFGSNLEKILLPRKGYAKAHLVTKLTRGTVFTKSLEITQYICTQPLLSTRH